MKILQLLPSLFGSRSRWLSVCCGLLLAPAAARATTVVPPEFPQLVNESDYVVRAVVKSVTAEWRGSREKGSIFTQVELDVLEVISGTPPRPLVLEMLGGKVGDEEMRVEGAPRFAVGQEDILFIKGNGRNLYPLYAMMHGRYPVLKDAGTGRRFVARSNLVPLEDTAEIALPMTEGSAADLQRRMKNPARAFTPEQLTLRIRTAIDLSYPRIRQN